MIAPERWAPGVASTGQEDAGKPECLQADLPPLREPCKHMDRVAWQRRPWNV